MIDAGARTRFTTHLEIETYTWDVLPPALKIDLLDSIAREYDWVLGASLARRPCGLDARIDAQDRRPQRRRA